MFSCLGRLFLNPHSRPQLPVMPAVLWASPATRSQSGQLSPAQLGLDVASGPAQKGGNGPFWYNLENRTVPDRLVLMSGHFPEEQHPTFQQPGMLLPDPTLPHLELSWKPALTSSEEPRLPPLMLKLLKHTSRTQPISLSSCPVQDDAALGNPKRRNRRLPPCQSLKL